MKIHLVMHKAISYSAESQPLIAYEREEQARAFVDMMATAVRGTLEVKEIVLEFASPLPAPPPVYAAA